MQAVAAYRSYTPPKNSSQPMTTVADNPDMVTLSSKSIYKGGKSASRSWWSTERHTSDLPSEMQARIHDLTAQAIDAVGIHCGPAHVEMMITDRGPVMIELGARMGGDCITTHLVPLSTGIDMIQATIDVSLGYTPDLSPRFTKGSAIRFF